MQLSMSLIGAVAAIVTAATAGLAGREPSLPSYTPVSMAARTVSTTNATPTPGPSAVLAAFELKRDVNAKTSTGPEAGDDNQEVFHSCLVSAVEFDFCMHFRVTDKLC